MHTLQVNLIDKVYDGSYPVFKYELSDCAEQLHTTNFFLIAACPSEGKIEVRYIHPDMPIYFFKEFDRPFNKDTWTYMDLSNGQQLYIFLTLENQLETQVIEVLIDQAQSAN